MAEFDGKLKEQVKKELQERVSNGSRANTWGGPASSVRVFRYEAAVMHLLICF
jgi:hypothetical protein